ncbi:MAG: hypothetical protein FWH11_14095 [Micrococcales bacterium]|nr:hypothetical protein [Micrococcales bacterium]
MRTGPVIGEDRGVDRPFPRRWAALAWAVAWGLVALAVYWSAVRTAWGQRLDDGLLERWHSTDLLVRLAAGAVRSWIPLVLVVVVAWLSRVAWRAGRRRVVWVVGSVLLVTAGLVPLLRDVLLTRPDLGAGGHNTLPSNHMAFSTALVVAVVVLHRCGARWAGLHQAAGAAPGVDRKTGAVLAALLVVEAVVNVTTYAHRPADMVVGFAVAMTLWSLALGVSPGLAQPSPGLAPGAPAGAVEGAGGAADTCPACREAGDASGGEPDRCRCAPSGPPGLRPDDRTVTR